MKFFKTPFVVKTIFNKCVWDIPSKGSVIYLTFDDGPQPGLTEFILDTLKSFNARGTFFCVGENIKRYSQLAKKIVSEGHEIGNHSFNHMKGWKTPNALYLENIGLFESTLESSLTRKNKTLLFRPPYGQISFKQINLLKKRGYEIIMWDVLSYDFVKNLDKESALNRIKRLSKPGTIVLFHDNFKAEENIRYLLPKYLDYFASRKYRFERISDGLSKK